MSGTSPPLARTAIEEVVLDDAIAIASEMADILDGFDGRARTIALSWLTAAYAGPGRGGRGTLDAIVSAVSWSARRLRDGDGAAAC